MSLILKSFTQDYSVTLVVGSNESELKVSSKMILRSEFLREKLATFQGNQNIRISVPQTTPEVMSLYLAFIHTGPHVLALPQVVTKSAISNVYVDLAKIYLVSRGLGDKGARNDVVTAMLNLSKIKDNVETTYPPSPDAVDLIYKNTNATSPIRQLLIDLWTPIPLNLIQNCKPLPSQFIKDILRAISNQDLDSKSLQKVLVAAMGVKEVQDLPKAALAKRPDAYMD